MKHRTVALAPFALVGLIAVLVTGSSALADGIDPEATELAKTDEAWASAAVKRNVDLLASFFADDAVVYPANDLIIVGRPAAKKYWASGFADPTYSISWKAVRAGVSKSGELGFTGGTYEFSFKGSDGKMFDQKGKYLTVWRKDRDGKWKVIHDIWNPDAR